MHPTAERCRRGLAGMIFLLLVFLNWQAKAQEIWFAPPDDLPRGAKIFSDDFSRLWTAPEEWTFAASHISVFVLSPYYASVGLEDNIKAISLFLTSRHIALAVGIQSLPVDGCGQGVEGMTKAGQPGNVARRLKRLGIDVKYFALDEPLDFGHNFIGKQACKYSIQEVAHRLAGTISDLRRVYPDAKIVDYEAPTSEPLPQWTARTSVTLIEWLDRYRAETGTPLDAMAMDSSWLEAWQQHDSETSGILHQHGIKAGLFLDAPGGPAVTDQSWMTAARKNIYAVQAAKLNLDFIIIASWTQHPRRNLPESDPLALSSLVKWYVTNRSNAR
jgi:hypothetical protein